MEIVYVQWGRGVVKEGNGKEVLSVEDMCSPGDVLCGAEVERSWRQGELRHLFRCQMFTATLGSSLSLGMPVMMRTSLFIT